jgi:hypothetical protein
MDVKILLVIFIHEKDIIYFKYFILLLIFQYIVIRLEYNVCTRLCLYVVTQYFSKIMVLYILLFTDNVR